MERSLGLDAEWDRVRVEEEPELWDLAVLEKKIRAECEAQGVPMFSSEVGLPLKWEHCQERIQLPGLKAGSACQPLWNGMVGLWWCKHCGADIQITREVDDAG